MTPSLDGSIASDNLDSGAMVTCNHDAEAADSAGAVVLLVRLEYRTLVISVISLGWPLEHLRTVSTHK